MHARAAELIALLDLRPHPEGGYYREIFRSSAMVHPGDGRPLRPALTTIHFLLVHGRHSRWHRVLSDEVWHLYEGGPLDLHELTPDAQSLTRTRLGRIGDGSDGPAHVVAAGRWQAASSAGAYTLVGCTVAPGFDFADFRLLSDEPPLASAVAGRWAEAAVFL